jgi:hypothetical protein
MYHITDTKRLTFEKFFPSCPGKPPHPEEESWTFMLKQYLKGEKIPKILTQIE